MNRSIQLSRRPSPIGWARSWKLAAGLPLALLTLLPASLLAVDPKPSPPEISFTFEALNIPALSPNFIGAGLSMLTLHFVDSNHLLVTYGLRELVPRLVGDPPDDDDRLVGAELVELPSGKILAKTRWHLHDHSRYLWNLGAGRFLLRTGDEAATFAPLANLQTKDPFQRTALPHRPGILDTVIVSPDGKLLTLETHKEEKQKLTGMNINTLTMGDLQPTPSRETYDFYRLSGAGSLAAPLELTHVGATHASGILRLPIDGDGYLVASGGRGGRWKVEFESFTGGKPLTVGVVDSACQPGLELVSSTQYLAFTCRNMQNDTMTAAAYDFAKHDIWEEPMGSFATYSPAFAFAPVSGRFAISRKLDEPAPGVAAGDTGTITTQEIRVYGTQTGDLLIKTYCVPAFRLSENFDLSSDGMRLAVIRNGNIEIYRLPELTKLDREDLAELAKLTPPPSSGPLNLHRIAHETADDVQESTAAAEASEVPTEDKTTAAAAKPVPEQNPAIPTPPGLASDISGPATSPSGDLQVRRKPPTLLNPGETAEGSSKSKSPQN